MHKHHCSSHLNSTRQKASYALKTGLYLILIFIGVQILGGYLANSLALMADAIHMATDAGSLALSLFAFWVAKKPSSTRMSYGYYRAEILGAVGSGLVLWAACGFLSYESFIRFTHPSHVEGSIVFVTAAITVVINIIVMRLLHPVQAKNLNVKAAYLHALSDLLGSIGILLAGALIWATKWNWIDPLITLIFIAVTLFHSWRMMSEAIEILMQATPRKIDPKELEKLLRSLPDVEDVHDLHIWTVSSNVFALSVHLITKQPQSVLDLAHQKLKQFFHIQHTTIQVEHPDTFQKEHCYDTMANTY